MGFNRNNPDVVRLFAVAVHQSYLTVGGLSRTSAILQGEI